MTLPQTILWILFISSFSLFGSWHLKKYKNTNLFFAIFATMYIFANVVVVKTIDFDLYFMKMTATSGTLAFAITYLIADLVNEFFGRKETSRMILSATICYAIFAVLGTIVMKTAPGMFSKSEAIDAIFGNSLRITLAGLATFFIVENLDACCFAWLRKMTGGKYLWMRGLFSTLPAMALDTVLFFTLAFYGIMPIVPLFTGIIVLKWMTTIISTPFLYLNRWVVGRTFVKSDEY